MPISNIPIIIPDNENVDDVSALSSSTMNGFIGEGGSLKKRPGLEEFVVTGTSERITSLYWWAEVDAVICTYGKNIARINKDGTIHSVFSTASQVTSNRPTFAFNGISLVCSFGSTLIRAVKSQWKASPSFSSFVADIIGAPDNPEYIASMNQYILATNKESAQVNFSSVGDATAWSALDFFTAELLGDDVSSIYSTVWNELYIFGNNSLEVWYDDGSTPWVPLSGAHSIRGTVSPDTIVLTDNEFYYLDTGKRVVKLANRDVVTVSQAVNKTLQDMSIFDDAIGNYMDIGGYAFYIISFPTEKITFAYNITTNTWSRWGYWNAATGEHEHWLVNAHCFPDTWGFHLVGDRRDTGKIYKLSFDNYDDDGDLIRVIRRTGHIDHGTSNLKKNRYLTFRFRRGDGVPSGDEPFITVKWKTDNKNGWSNEKQLSLKKIGNTDFISKLHRTGIYRTRQYEIVSSENAPFTLVSVEEDYKVLSR